MKPTECRLNKIVQNIFKWPKYTMRDIPYDFYYYYRKSSMSLLISNLCLKYFVGTS